MHITLVISSLSCGGAERVMAIIANYWASRGKRITLITLASEAADFYTLHPEVKRVALGLTAASTHPWEALKNNLHRLRRLRQEIRASQPSVVISFEDTTNLLALLASLGLNVPVIVSEHTDPRYRQLGRLRSTLRTLLYPRADAVIVLTDVVRRWAQRFIRRAAVHTIPNPATPPVRRFHQAEPLPLSAGHRIVAVGRLAPVKGFDLLLRAFAQCAAEHPDWSLVVLGEGAERWRLETLAGELGIADRVYLPGRVEEPQEYLQGADLFVMSSRYEGFPMALLEAMSCGLPAVTFDCPSGPREIVRDGIDGVLVENGNVHTLAKTMDRLMSDEVERTRLGSRAAEVTERFGVEKVIGLWENVLDQTAQRRGPLASTPKKWPRARASDSGSTGADF